MHKSVLAGFIIDCNTINLEGAADFWSKALGMQIKKLPAPEGEKYIKLENSMGLHIEVQKVSHPSRVHLDIATNNIEAEKARLEKLGAKCIEYVHTWCVMEAPTGQRFCLVSSKNSENFDQIANTHK